MQKLISFLMGLVVFILPFQRHLEGRIYQIAVFCIVLVLFISAFSSPGVRPIAAKFWILSAFLIPVAGLFSGTSSNVEDSFTVSILFAAMFGCAPFALARSARGRKTGTWLVICFLSSQSISALVGLTSMAGVVIVEDGVMNDRAAGLAGHPNRLGFMALCAVLLTVALLLRRGAKPTVLLTGVALINFAALLATGSLSAISSTLVGLLLLSYIHRRHIGKLLPGVLLLAVALSMLPKFHAIYLSAVQFIANRFVTVTESSGGASSINVRRDTYTFALERIRSDPFLGVGMDSTNAVTDDGKTVVHNYLLHAWFQGGILLLFVFLGASIIAIYILFQTLKNKELWGFSASLGVACLVFASTSAWFVEQFYWIPLLTAIATFGISKNMDSMVLESDMVNGRTAGKDK